MARAANAYTRTRGRALVACLIAACWPSVLACDHKRIFVMHPTRYSYDYGHVPYIPPDCTILGPFFDEQINIKDEGIIAISKHLETNDWVQQLFLDKNMISDTGIAAFAGAMARNAKGKISKIDLLDNDIGNGGAIALADMLKVQAADEQRTVLRQLNLRQNKIGNKGVAALAGAFAVTKRITSIQLSRNNIGDKGAIALAKMLATNTVITSVDLEENNIGDAGVVALAKALETNTVLRQLTLTKNSVGEEGAVALAAALKKNNVLQGLGLTHNKITQAGGEALEAALKCCNQKLNSLGLLGLFGNKDVKYKTRKSMQDIVEDTTRVVDAHTEL